MSFGSFCMMFLFYALACLFVNLHQQHILASSKISRSGRNSSCCRQTFAIQRGQGVMGAVQVGPSAEEARTKGGCIGSQSGGAGAGTWQYFITHGHRWLFQLFLGLHLHHYATYCHAPSDGLTAGITFATCE